jgi:transposase
MAFPDWVVRQKKTGYEIKEIKGNYYMYKLKSRWDPTAKKPKKVTGEYIGVVTPDGIRPPKTKVTGPIFSYEYGAAAFLHFLAGDLLTGLRDHFDRPEADAIWAMAMLRLAKPCPFRRIGERYETSWMSKLLPGLHLSKTSVTTLLRNVGANREACAGFMRETSGPSPYVLIDGTRTVSKSEGIGRALPGHSHSNGYEPQLNQIYILSAAKDGCGTPAFYRNAAGNIPDVTAFELAVTDAGTEGVTVIADAGFASADNFELLSDAKLRLEYVVPLKRNTAEVDLGKIGYEDVFSYHQRAISAHSEMRDGYRVCVYRDEKMRAKEMSDFVARGEKANTAAEGKKNFDPDRDLRDIPALTAAGMDKFGTIILRTSLLDASPKHIYETYKIRWQIEQLFDTMRNSCDLDTGCMHDDIGFEAWSFVNHVTLMAACRILTLLRRHKLEKEWSLVGFLDCVSHIHVVRVKDSWHVAETIKKTRNLLAGLGFALPPSDKPIT